MKNEAERTQYITSEKEVENFCQRLHIKYCEELLPFYREGIELFRKQGYAVLDKERLIRLNDKYYIFRRWFGDVLAAADAIREDEDLLIYIYTLVAVIKGREKLSLLQAPDRQRMDTDFAPLFGILYFLEDAIQEMEDRGVPFQVISDSMNGFENDMNAYFELHGRSGMRSYVRWFIPIIRGELLWIGRLQFEMTTLPYKIRVYQRGEDIKVLMDDVFMHEKGMLFGSAGQTDEASKYWADITEEAGKVSGYGVNEFGECIKKKITLCGYEEKLRYKDPIISVHIPSDGNFSAQVCEESYRRAKEIFKKCYPEYKYKAMCCFSWMLEKRLKEIMGKDTNVTLFADKYVAFPLCSKGEDIYSFLYHLKEAVPPEELPEDTSMQRAVKNYLLDGNYFYEKGGFFL